MLTAMVSLVAAPLVLNGIDVLERDGFAPLRGRRVGIITNHTGRTRDGRSTVDVLVEAEGVEVVALFAPEHGIRGDKDERIVDGRDEKTGLPVYSLYNPGTGEMRYRPRPEQLQGVETLVFDIQDIGARFYTYVGTMGFAMEEAAKLGISFVVLDRPNPITGTRVEGPIADTNRLGLTAYRPIPVRHGMTAGELARMFLATHSPAVDLTVVPMEGWQRSMWFEETGQSWIDPSPNMRSPIQATLYPGICLVEATNLSVGRGTDAPFERVGAPWLDGVALAARLNAKRIPGIVFYPRTFTPNASKFANQECGGVGFWLINRDVFDAVWAGCELAYEIARAHPEFERNAVVNLLQNQSALDTLYREGYFAARHGWEADLRAFLVERERYLIYR